MATVGPGPVTEYLVTRTETVVYSRVFTAEELEEAGVDPTLLEAKDANAIANQINDGSGEGDMALHEWMTDWTERHGDVVSNIFVLKLLQ